MASIRTYLHLAGFELNKFSRGAIALAMMGNNFIFIFYGSDPLRSSPSILILEVSVGGRSMCS